MQFIKSVRMGVALLGPLVLGLVLVGCGGGGSTPNDFQGYGNLVGQVTAPDGGGVEGIVVVAEKVENGITPTVSRAIQSRGRADLSRAEIAGRYSTFTDSSGKYTFSDLPAGLYTVTAQKVGVGAALQTHVAVRSRVTTVVDLELTPTGNIAGKATVEGRDDNSFIIVAILGTSYLAVTQADGSYEISNVPVGTYTLTALDPQTGRRGAVSDVTVVAGQTTEDMDIEIPAGPGPGTDTLQAIKVTSVPTGVNDPAWEDLPHRNVPSRDMSTGILYGDGQLNMTGTFGGLATFNGGAPPNLRLKAAYDDEHLYLLAEWEDTTFNVDRRRALYDGPADPRKPGESAEGWTSQLNDDKIALAFATGDPTGITSNLAGAGQTFVTKGCLASCHSDDAGHPHMSPDTGIADIWHWKTSRTEGAGYVNDQRAIVVADRTRSGRGNDAAAGAQHVEVRNRVTTDRSGPKFLWDGTPQTLTFGPRAGQTLDPAYFLLTGHLIDVTAAKPSGLGIADASTAALQGKNIYVASCQSCHGTAGGGGAGPAFNTSTTARRDFWSLKQSAAAGTHPAAATFNALSDDDQNAVLLRLLGFRGVPGYYLQQPLGSGADLETDLDLDLSQIDNHVIAGYRLMIKRRLLTGYLEDDVQFDLNATRSYPFGVAVMDNDGENHVGSNIETLEFIP